MSDYETHKGKLIPTELTKEEVVKDFLDNYSRDWKWVLDLKSKEHLTDNDINELFWDIEEYSEINGKIYIIEDEYFRDDDDLFIMKQNSDGTLEYLVRFYNGGCGFEEALEYAAEKMKNLK